MQPSLHSRSAAPACTRRGGAVIIVVLALLSLMIFLGVFFFEFVQEEQQAAGNFAANTYENTLNPERYLNEADKQLIIGPDATRIMSVLSSGDAFSTSPPAGLTYGTPGTSHSILAHEIGRMQPTLNGLKPTDVLPHSGHGITVTYVDNDADGAFGPGDFARFDLDGDGTPDAVLDPVIDSGLGLPGFGFNFSRPAQANPAFDAFGQPLPINALRPFQPDVEYTYPDINNPFLAYDMTIAGRRILVPSFHRPDLFPAMRQSGFQNLYTDPTTKRMVMRPHSGHRYSDSTPRFLVADTQAQSGDRTRFIRRFPFTVGTNQMGIYSDPSGNAPYELDVDLNGDGLPDGIWMDLGMDIVDMADGRQFVPLVSFYILDADSLINLNAHGNTQGIFENGAGYNSTPPIAPFSVSNTGASPSEVNPLRVLTGDPAAFTVPAELAFAQAEHAYAFGAAGVNFSANTAQPVLTMANMEWAFFTMGRPQSRSGSQLSGRYGEEYRVGQYAGSAAVPLNQLPRPGITVSATGYDDDLDSTPDGIRYQGGALRYPTIYDPRAGASTSVVTPYGSHPIAPKGTGSGAYSATGQAVVQAVTGSPVVWPQYQSGWEAPLSTTLAPAGAAIPNSGPYPYGPAALPFTTALFPVGTNSMTDEDDETRLNSPDRVNDDIFGPEENLRLQLSSADYERVGGSSRVARLAPFNIGISRTAPQTRKLFGTDSWDFSELPWVPSRYAGGARPETSFWAPGRKFFPPAFGATLFSATDPVRPELRALLALEDTDYVNQTGTSRRELNSFPYLAGAAGLSPAALWRQPLNLNKLLVGFDPEGYPIFRTLMPHPDIVAMEYQDASTSMPALAIPAMIHSNDLTLQPIPPTAAFTNIILTPTTDAQRATTAVALEWWARYDRQRMARDVYTLLYLIGAPNGLDPTTTVYPNAEKVREMAQFAVNYVDALDRDDVITKFEYDDNLTNGWDAPSKSVYGIEATSVSFSEAQFLQTNPLSSDYASTLHKDQTDVHQFLHMELRNSSPFVVNLGEGWRISRVVRGTGTRDLSVQFKTKGFGSATAIVQQIAPGANFLMGTHDGTVQNAAGITVTSDFYADIANGGELESVLPSSTNTIVDNSANPNPQTDLDLSISGLPAPFDHESYLTYVPGTSGYAGTRLVERIPAGTPALVQFDLVLERRQNLYGIEVAGDATSLGDWIEVDRFSVDTAQMSSVAGAQFNPTVDDQPGMQAALLVLRSVERRQPFDPVQVQHTAVSSINHSMSALPATKHAANQALASLVPVQTRFNLWQPHFDRDLTSAYELLSIPLYGNWPLTEMATATNTGVAVNTFYKEIHGGTQFNLAPGATAGSSGRMSGDFTAGIRFNFPNGIPGRPYQGWNPYAYQNCWYRLFDFVSVPRRADQQSEEYLNGPQNRPGSMKPVFRVPGKLNLNTLRDETILAALLDDEVHLDYSNGTNDNLTPGRNWFLELLRSRDGVDFFAGPGGVPIPNSIASHPFRGNSKVDPSWTATSDNGIESGLLRTAGAVGRGLNSLRPVAGGAYTTPVLTAPTVGFTSTGIWSGAPTYDTSTVNWQSLFDSGDLTTSTGIDHHTRNRILAKIANNSTNKSHVYYVWTAVGYFEAHREGTNNRAQIGARITDIPIHRRFSVVDMSRLEEAYNTTSNTFDEKKFVIYQKRLR